ncbi:M23 family metallopeptidase [Allopusillimonas soli]|uniref:M23 family metallopeptidase n=1 Tax=Allopusillimonas soli TaxID=659016 RepID=A0A853F6E0_9BURK|nr:M23 family metallopeptidase [Allopusillimonas soli]NYT36135.1 M23 family metallopeptidase [Allopusillimonas soli]TEA76469.1 M23 family metallopeptidase [Allopusillimonas soli]
MFEKGKTGTPSYREITRAHRPHHFFRNGLVLIALGLFATAAALAVVKPPEPPALYQATQTLLLPAPQPLASGTSEQPYISETEIRRGDTLAALLQRLQIDEPGLQSFLVRNKNARAIYKLYPGRTVQAALDADGRMVWLRYNHGDGEKDGKYLARWLEIRPDNGGYVAEERSEVAATQVHVAEGQINSSLFGATDAAGIPDSVTMQMTDILGSKVDFLRDLRRGDRFRVVYESYAYQGQEVGAGRILALEFENKDKVYEAVWFAPDGGNGSYYDFNGHSLKGAFLRNAIKFTRISSTFGMRKHPIRGSWRQHKGVDYAAPTGTPIHATADGVVSFIGKQRGYGNVIVLKHWGDYSTLYGHQSRFAKGLRKGDKVSQGDIIGYVGATGWATGPHLHYEFRIDGKQVDPLSVDLPVARTLDPHQMQAFETMVARYRDHIDLVARGDSETTRLASR